MASKLNLLIGIIILRACTASGVTAPWCYDAAVFKHLQMCNWTIEGNNSWDNGWQNWTLRCMEVDDGK